MLPALITAIRSATSIASSWSWVTSTVVRPLLIVQSPQPRPQLGADVGVQRAERLVEQQHLRLDGQRPGQCHPLALAARELGGPLLGPLGQPDERQQLVDALLGSRPWAACRIRSPKATFSRTVMCVNAA